MNALFAMRYRILACFGFIGAMLLVRIFFSGEIRYLFLVWNIFLAWLPYLFSLLYQHRFFEKKIMQLLLTGAWLSFFPNALYIVTDIIHLRDAGNIPVWFDAVLLFLSALTGLILAFASLINTEKALQRIISPKYINGLMVFLIFLGSFGVYIGRFLRWNSWNIITHPYLLISDLFDMVIHPFGYLKVWAITFFLAALYCFIWYLVKAAISKK